jgi:hypothetical protein
MKKKLYIYKNNIILFDGSLIKENSIKYFKNNQLNFLFKKKKVKKGKNYLNINK